EPQRARGQPAPQLGLDVGGRAQRRHLTAVGHGRPQGHHAEQRQQRAPQRRHGRAPAGGGGERVREQAGLGQDQQRSRQPQDHGGRQVAAGGPGIAKQTG